MNLQFSKSNLLRHPLMALFQLSTFCGLLILLRVFHSSNITYLFLGWNLFLAWVPLFFAWLWRYRLQAKPLRRWKSLGMFGFWLLFFPNSPYIITDLVHLNTRFNPSLWSDTLLLFSCALTGLVAGLYSLHIIHKILDRFFRTFTSWVIVAGSLVLTGFGIYLGRVQRWNSWDLFTNPWNLMQDVFLQMGNSQAIQMTIGFSALLFIVYFMLRSITTYGKSDQ